MFKECIQNLIKIIIGTNQTIKINMFNVYKLSNLSNDIDKLTLDVYLNIQKEEEINSFIANYLNNLPITLQVLQINFNIATDNDLNKEIILNIIKENIKIPFNCILINTFDVYNPYCKIINGPDYQTKYIKYKLAYNKLKAMQTRTGYYAIIDNINNKNL